MDQTETILSIIVPTKNRLIYAQHSLKNILTIKDKEIELIVQDNSDSAELQTWIRKNIDDTRLKYFYSSRKLSMSQNYDLGLEHSNGRYISFIGDDDGVNPEIVQMAKWMFQHYYDAVVASSNIDYGWPDLRLKYHGDAKAGKLFIKEFTGKIFLRDPQKEILNCVRSGGIEFAGLPKVYYGIVKRECMQKIKEKTGTYFPGISPDLASAIAAAIVIKDLRYIDYPLFIPGSSGGSNAGLGGLKKHSGKLEIQAHLEKKYIEGWSKIVPKFFSVQTVWAESAVSTLSAMGKDYDLQYFNIPRLHAMTAVFNPRYSLFTTLSLFRALHYQKKWIAVGFLKFIFYVFQTFLLRAEAVLNRIFKHSSIDKAIVINSISTIETAAEVLTQYLTSRGYSIEKFLREKKQY